MTLRILHVTHGYAPLHGGGERQAQRLSEELAARGHQVRVVTGAVTSPEAYYQLGIGPIGPSEERLNGVEIHRIPFGGWLYRHGVRLPSALAERVLNRARGAFCSAIDREIGDFRPDVVMTLPHLFINVRCVLAVHQRQPFPLVLVPLMHEDDPYWPVDDLRQAIAQAQAIVATTDHEAARLRDTYGAPPEKVFVGRSGVDLPDSAPERTRQARILYLGRKSPTKGLALLVRAMQLVWQIRPDTELVLAGHRVPATRELDSLIEALPASERSRVHSLDDVSEADKGELLATSTCLVLPSTLESFGIVVLEAWAYATPVVALDTPVLGSLVTEGQDGLLVPPGDPEVMSRAILTLLADAKQAAIMGCAGYQRVADEFRWSQVADRYLEAYRFAVSQDPTAAPRKPAGPGLVP